MSSAEPILANIASAKSNYHIGPFPSRRLPDGCPVDVVLGADSLCDDWLVLLREENSEAANMSEQLRKKSAYPHIWRKVSYVRPERRTNAEFFNKQIESLKEWKTSPGVYRSIGGGIVGFTQWLTQRKYRVSENNTCAIVTSLRISGVQDRKETNFGEFDPRREELLGLHLGLTQGVRYPENLASISENLCKAISSLTVEGNLVIEWSGLVHHPFVLFLAKLLMVSFKNVRICGDSNIPDFIGCYIVGLGFKTAEPMIEFLQRFHRTLFADDALCWWLGMVESFAVFRKLQSDFNNLFQMTTAKLAKLHEYMNIDLVALKARVLVKIKALRYLNQLFLDVVQAKREAAKKPHKASRANTPHSSGSPRRPKPNQSSAIAAPTTSPGKTLDLLAPSRDKHPSSAEYSKATAVPQSTRRSEVKNPSIHAPPKKNSPQKGLSKPATNPVAQKIPIANFSAVKKPPAPSPQHAPAPSPQPAPGPSPQPAPAPSPQPAPGPSPQPAPAAKSLGAITRQESPKRQVKAKKEMPPNPIKPQREEKRSIHEPDHYSVLIEKIHGSRKGDIKPAIEPIAQYVPAVDETSIYVKKKSEKKQPKIIPRVDLREYLALEKKTLFDPSPLDVYDKQSLMAYSIPIPYVPDSGKCEDFRVNTDLDLKGVYKPEIPIVKTRNRILVQFKI